MQKEIKTENLNLKQNGELTVVTFPVLDKYGVKNAYTTRIGGYSKGIFSTVNMSFSRGDNREDVLNNYKAVCDTIGVDYKKCVLSRQTHTVNIMNVREEHIGMGITKEREYDDIDGLITDIPGVTLVTQFADCVGLLFYDTKKKVIAASHAGWRGTVNLIGKLTVEKMVSDYGCNPDNIAAAVAPSICKSCFEVDKPVADEFLSVPLFNNEKTVTDYKNGKYHIDLWQANLDVLLSAGIKPENIDVTDLCTMCNPDIFFSHRATKGKRGNNAALICL